MFNAIQGRIGHTVDTFAVIGTEHVSLNYGSAESQSQAASVPLETSKKHSEDDAVQFQEKLRMRSRVARFFDAFPRYARAPITHEQALHMEEARQVIHGVWKAHHSEKLWSVLNREEDVDFTFDDINPATMDHFITGMCKIEPEFKSTHLKHLLCLNLAKTSEKTRNTINRYVSYNSRRLYSNVHNVVIFGGAIPSDRQMESCRNTLSVAGILEAIDDLKVTNDLYVLSFRDAMSPWRALNTIGAPIPRAFHASTIIYLDFATPALCITGGFGYNRRLMDMTLHVLCLIQKKKELTWVNMNMTGPLPPKRYGHTMGQVGPWLAIFGGTNGRELFNDLWVFNICEGTVTYKTLKSANQWVRVDIIGLIPPPRCFHAAVRIGIDPSNPIVIYGGITNDLTSRAYTLREDKYGEIRWSVLPISIRGPNECRAFHSMVYADGQVIIGGGEDFRALHTTVHRCLVYTIKSKEFHYADEALTLSGHRSAVINGVMYHFGGLRNICSSVYLEPIANPKGMRDALEVRNAIEQHYIRELTKEQMKYSKGKQTQTDTTTTQAAKPATKTRGEPQTTKKTNNTVTFKADEINENRSMGRPRRSAAEKCAQHIGEEVAKMMAKIKEKEDKQNQQK